MTRVVILMQENKTPDFYFPSLAIWGAEVRNGGNLLPAPPLFDQKHDRNAWVHYKMGDFPAVDLQIDNDTLIPFYSWLAKQFTFCDHHFGLGTNSTPGHMLAVGGQTPTMRNPRQNPVWDLPTIFKHVERGGHSWAAFPDKKYPVQFYAELSDAASQANIYPPRKFIEMARRGTLPDFCFAWSPAGYDEHPPFGKVPRSAVHPEGPRSGLAAGRRRGARWGLGGYGLHSHLGRLGRLHRPRRHAERGDCAGRVAPRGLPGDWRLAHPAGHVRRSGQAGDRVELALPREHPEDGDRPVRSTQLRGAACRSGAVPRRPG